MLDQERIVSFMKVVGPTLPSRVAKNIKGEILIASAHLSDLAAQGKVKISALKVGGSPLYYLPGQEEQLYQYAQANMNPKDFQVLEALREKKVLRETNLDLLYKVALRSLKDFAQPLQVKVQDQPEIFWKWHLVPAAEANQIIAQMISGEEIPIIKVPAAKEEVPPEPRPAALTAPLSASSQKSVTHPRIIVKEKEVRPAPPENKYLVEEMMKHEELMKHEEQKKLAAVEAARPKAEGIRIEEIARKSVDKLLIKELTTEPETIRPEIAIPKVREKTVRKRRTTVEEEFLPQLEHFLKKLKIVIEQKEMLRKNAEFNFLLKVPSVVGNLTYFCKAKNKAKCDEKDLSSAYMEAQVKKLPLLFLYPKELSPKALELLNSGAFDNLVVKRME